MLTVLLILVTGYVGFIRLKRDRKSNQIGRGIFKIVLDDDDASPESQLKKLAKKRDDIAERVPKRWFEREELDKPRWRDLNDLIEYWRRVAKGNLTRDLVAELGRYGGDASLNDAQRLDRRNDLLQRVRKYLEDDEIEASQYELLTKLIQEELSERAPAEVR